MNHAESYINELLQRNRATLADAVKNTINDIVPQYIENFSYREHVVSLLMGNVQSGKTSHMFGLIAAAADQGFNIFVLLTTDNTLLQEQTFKRALADLDTFCVCGENDYIRFQANALRKPVLLVLKKNVHVLQQWKNNFSSTNFCAGNPLFIVDDEADAASPNTKVNQKDVSAINRTLNAIKKTSSSSIYLQVTGTPQSLLLQTKIAGWKPQFIYYFEPGKGYLGGDFFFSDEKCPHVIPTDNDEGKELLQDDEFPENGLKQALLMHLVSSAHLFLNGSQVSNFVVHPSVKVSEHQKFANKIGEYLNELNLSIDEDCTIETLHQTYDNLKTTKPDIAPFDDIYSYIKETLEKDQINVLVINSKASYDENARYETGLNIVVGGNSLGRGITFPMLQTIYYCRVAKNPQADTMWQHSRMFGYDRDPGLVRVFMPPLLIKRFSEINKTNNSIINQINKAKNADDIKMYYPKTLRPTRKNVIDNSHLNMLVGGVSYFPFYPTNDDISQIDNILSAFSENDGYSVNLQLIYQIIQMIDSEKGDWNKKSYLSFLKSYISEDPSRQGVLIVRRGRDIAKGTGTLLSPNDRALVSRITDKVSLTLYKVTGTKGWDGKEIWIPNIKFPDGLVFYDVN
ncbi:MAG: Z1 domain-containing protein [[Eubacterium] siraeum]|jgi:hypothetical protein|uniref:Z1 domain-containing protein n=1 Tax=[Eubacterium] siraeum TaxID=39492 RepID=A0AAW6CZH6_9FIRM|nr:Z1 domain-containing protein [[Eubacterium] siraeum]MDB8003584.1 Z1 domain-containing protein [[Eubacterium] siraeum]